MTEIKTKIRQSNFELLRIVAMFLIIISHILARISIEESPASFSLNVLLVNCRQMFGTVGNMLFIFISGWFITETTFSWRKFAALWFEVFFYSVAIGVIFFVFHFSINTEHGERMFGSVDLIKSFFPTVLDFNWFATAYLGFFLFSPFLAMFTAKLTQEQHKALAVLSLFMGTFPLYHIFFRTGSTFPFFTLYFVISYIRRFPPHFLESPQRCFALGGGIFVLMILWDAVVTVASMHIDFVHEHLQQFLGVVAGIIKLPPVLCGICVFCGMRKISIKPNRFINMVAASTFGVYLIHENNWVRQSMLWQRFFHTDTIISSSWMVPYVLGLSFAVFIVCTIVDMLRKHLFAFVAKIVSH